MLFSQELERKEQNRNQRLGGREDSIGSKHSAASKLPERHDSRENPTKRYYTVSKKGLLQRGISKQPYSLRPRDFEF